MLDLETLGLNTNAPIIQVGMVFFTLDGVFLSTLANIDFEDAIKHGNPDGSTIKWWLQQPKEAQDTLAKNERSTKEVCEIVTKLVMAQNPDHFWSHASFDFPILNSTFASVGLDSPLHYKKLRDIRTLEMLCPDYNWTPRVTVGHNALNDATYQAENVINMLRKLKGI